MVALGLQQVARCVQIARPARPQGTRAARNFRVFAQSSNTTESDIVDANVNPYCSLDGEGKKPMKELSLGEKEQLFLEALSAYYFTGKPSMSDQEFDNLKDELVWEGSKVAVLSGDEQKFLEAQQAFNAGKPIMNDTDYDALKQKLRQGGSFVTAQGPRCSIRSRAVYSDAQVDYTKMVAINIPPALLVLGAVFSIDDLTGFEITKLIELPPPYGIVLLWGVLLPTVYVLANAIANLLFKDALILKAPCPNCNTENTTYFGDILTVTGNRDKNTVDCPGCKAKLTFDALEREVEVTQMPAPAKAKA